MKNHFKSLRSIPWLLCGVLLFSSCEKDADNPENPSENSLNVSNNAEIAFPGQEGTVETINFFGNPLQAEKIGKHYVVEGDMLVIPDKDVLSAKSTGRSLQSTRWPNNTVYYEIQPGLPNQQRITNAIAAWEAIAPLRFVERTNQEDYIFFQTGGGCSSFVGRIGGVQEITLANNCGTGNTIHEIGHALGLWHEQSRVDREEFITINFENIQPRAVFNFETYATQGFDGAEFTDDLDFSSIMLYGSFFFSANGLPTIVRKDGSTFNANRAFLSDGDIAGINIMYPETDQGDICNGVDEFVSGQTYQPGDRVTFRGNLFERTTNSWNFLGACASNDPSVKSGSFQDLNDYDK